MFVIKVDDLALLPILDPIVTRDLAVVSVICSVTVLPGVVFARREFETMKEKTLLEALLVPVVDKVHHLVTKVRLDPSSLYSSPRFFFRIRCSSINSESTESLR